MWTVEQIAELLRKNDQAVNRAMVVLYERQTLDEQATVSTQHRNGQGFSAAHVRLGTYYARYVLRGRRLTERHLERARKIALHYTKQLCEAANAKATHETR